MSLGVRYAHKWVDYAIEAVCNFTPSGEEDCGVNNPGFGSELGTFPLGRSNPAQPAAVRDYDGIEFRLRKRLSNRWSADVSYLYSALRGNWSGIASSDEAVGSLQPNSGRSFNLLYYSYDAQGNVTTGRLGTDRPHQFKVQGTYDLPWGTMVGVNAIVESGVPKSTIMSQKNINFFPYGRGDLGRDAVVLTGGSADSTGVPSGERDARARRSQCHQPLRSEDGDAVTRPRRIATSSTSATRCSSPGSIRRRWRPRPTSAAMRGSDMANGFQDVRVIRFQARLSF